MAEAASSMVDESDHVKEEVKEEGKKKQKKNKHRNNKNSEKQKQKATKEDVFSKKQDPVYEEYWDRALVSTGLKRGELVQGTLRINRKDYTAAYIDDPNGGPDYLIPKLWSRNRAFDGDEVVIQVMPSDKWEEFGKQSHDDEVIPNGCIPSSKEGVTCVSTTNGLEESDRDDHIPNGIPSPDGNDTDNEGRDTLLPSSGPTLIDALYSCTTSFKGGCNNSSQRIDQFVQDGKDLKKWRRTSKVVYIVRREHSRACAGTIKVFDKIKELSIFSPCDSRVPRVIVPLSDLPQDYVQNHSKYETTLFVCSIVEWKNDSTFPFGRLKRSLGEAGEIEPETTSILTEYQVDDDEFPKEVLDCLPKFEDNNDPWKISEDEIKKRRDFRQDCVLSIDPSTARDLDDALHCKEISPGVYEVGVHIADVSHFIDPKTALDKMAADRATSVYLVQRVIPMLPRQLCENLCSLNPHEEKLTFSVVWQLTLKGELLDEWMGKSLICSRAKLSYEEAQRMIDEPDNQWTLQDFPNVADEDSVPTVVHSVVTLNKLAKQLRFLRQKRGTLRLDQPKLCFSLDKTTGLPNGCNVHQHKESNKLIEEFMLLANMAVAQKISKHYPAISLLRRHPSPKARAMDSLREQCKIIGVTLDFSTAGSLQKSLSQYVSKSADEAIGIMEKQLLTNFCCKVMELARYFCTGCVEEDSYLHYALNVPRYTHFTSPIRRYADVVVHRLLASVLDQGPTVAMSTEDVDEQAQHCNKKRKNAKVVEEFSSGLFLGVFIRECGPLTYPGMVQAILNKSLDVYVPSLAIIKRVYFEKLPIKEFKYEPPCEGKGPSVCLVWNKIEQVLKIFSPVNVVLTSQNKTLKFDATITSLMEVSTPS